MRGKRVGSICVMERERVCDRKKESEREKVNLDNYPHPNPVCLFTVLVLSLSCTCIVFIAAAKDWSEFSRSKNDSSRIALCIL